MCVCGCAHVRVSYVDISFDFCIAQNIIPTYCLALCGTKKGTDI